MYVRNFVGELEGRLSAGLLRCVCTGSFLSSVGKLLLGRYASLEDAIGDKLAANTTALVPAIYDSVNLAPVATQRACFLAM